MAIQTFPPASEVVYIIKTNTGDPAAPTGGEVVICSNTVDNNLKVYADGSWRTIVTW